MGGFLVGGGAAQFHVRMLKSDFNMNFMTLCVGSTVTWDQQDFSPEVCRQGGGSWQAGVTATSTLLLQLLAEKGLSVPVPLSCLPVFPQALDAVSSFKPTLSKYC